MLIHVCWEWRGGLLCPQSIFRKVRKSGIFAQVDGSPGRGLLVTWHSESPCAPRIDSKGVPNAIFTLGKHKNESTVKAATYHLPGQGSKAPWPLALVIAKPETPQKTWSHVHCVIPLIPLPGLRIRSLLATCGATSFTPNSTTGDLGSLTSSVCLLLSCPGLWKKMLSTWVVS